MRALLALACSALRGAAPLALPVLAVVACSGAGGTDAPEDDIDFTTSAGSGGSGASGACALYEVEALEKPLHLYLLVDKSSSMAGSKWDAAMLGLSSFVVDEASAGIRAGLRFFPRDPDAAPVCDQHAYSEPSVPFAPIPGAAAPLLLALADEEPDGFSSPMWPALGGAILKSIALAEDTPGSVSAVLLVTDGKPEGPAESCAGVDPDDAQEVANLAAIGADFDPPVITYVVGLPGVDQTAAGLIAEAGGSGDVILVGSTDVQGEFQEALATVRGTALPCSYGLPEVVLAGEVGLGYVNVKITPEEGEAYTLPFDEDCSSGGWHYAPGDPPSELELCPGSCSELKALKNAAIRVVMGCVTFVE